MGTTTTTQPENKMGTMSIPKLLFTISVPMMISMLIQALYNIVDSIYVAKLSEDALTAVSLAFPIQNLMIAVAVGTGVGINAFVSRYLGQKEFAHSNEFAKNGLFLTFIHYILFALIGGFFSYQFYAIQTSKQVILDYGSTYMRIVCICSFGLFFQITIERLLQSTGKTILNMIVQGSGALINIILDPILIFGLFGFPRMEVAGAALATIIGQISGCMIGIILCIKYNKEININMKQFVPNKEVIWKIYQIGFPAIIMQAIGSIMVFGINKILLLYSTTAAAVFGIYFKLQSFVFMPVFGITNGLVSIIAYNFGARKKERILRSFRLACIASIMIMFLGTCVFILMPTWLLTLFDASEQMLKIGIPALRIISLSFALAGYNIVASSAFQALGYSVYSLLLSVVRQLVAILPLAFLLATYLGLSSTWWAFPIAEIIAALLCIVYTHKVFKKTIYLLP